MPMMTFGEFKHAIEKIDIPTFQFLSIMQNRLVDSDGLPLITDNTAPLRREVIGAIRVSMDVALERQARLEDLEEQEDLYDHGDLLLAGRYHGNYDDDDAAVDTSYDALHHDIILDPDAPILDIILSAVDNWDRIIVQYANIIDAFENPPAPVVQPAAQPVDVNVGSFFAPPQRQSAEDNPNQNRQNRGMCSIQ